MDPLDQYSNIQALVKKEIADAIAKYADDQKYAVTQVPVHTHNGIDSSIISEVNLDQNIKITTQIISTQSEVNILNNIPSISQIQINGIAYNDAGTKKASVTGSAQFGDCYNFDGTNYLSQASVSVSNAIYIDTTDLTKTTVTAGTDIFDVLDNTGTNVAKIVVTYTGSQLFFTVTLDSVWNLKANITIR